MRNALIGAAAGLALAACAAVPRATNELQTARATYRGAAANPEVQARAPFELQAAERARLEAAARPKQAEAQAAPLASELKRLETGASAFTSRETDRGWVLTFGSAALFDKGAATLTPEGRKAVEGVAQLMKQHPARGIAVEGYTDSGGTAERSRQISQARAEAVKQVLIEHGVQQEHVWTRAYGSEFPLADKERVEVVIAPPATASTGASSR